MELAENLPGSRNLRQNNKKKNVFFFFFLILRNNQIDDNRSKGKIGFHSNIYKYQHFFFHIIGYVCFLLDFSHKNKTFCW